MNPSSASPSSGSDRTTSGLRSLSRDIPIKFLLVAGFLLAGLVPVIIGALLSLNAGKEALRNRAIQQLESVRTLKKAQLQRFFEEKLNDVITLASLPFVLAAQRDLCAAFQRSGGASSGAFRGLDHGRYDAPPSYRQVHDRHLPLLEAFIQRHGYYDLFLLDPRHGEICFTVEKERDFGGRISAWPHSLQDVWREVIGGASTALSDTKLYAPSANAAAQFVAAPLRDTDGHLVGVLALQIGLNGINDILSVRAGMGETGETYLVGSDHRMRSDASLDPEGHSVSASFTRPVEESGIATPPVDEALSGEEGTWAGLNYRNQQTLAAFSPLQVGEATWALVAEVEAQEIEAQIDQAFNREVLYALGLSVLLVLGLGLLLSTFIILEIRRLTSGVKQLSRRVLEGDLTSQEVPGDLGVDFQEVVGQLNGLVRAFVSHLDLLPAPLILVDTECRIRFANLALAELLGRPRDELLLRQYMDVFSACDLGIRWEDRAGPLICEAMSAGEVVRGETVVEVAGEEVFYYSTAAPLWHPDGGLRGSIEVLVDQTEARQMEQEKATLEQQLAETHRLDSLGTLASGIAHDFNNIMGYLLAYADIVRGMIPEDSPAHGPLDSLGEGVERASELVDRILTFSRQARSPSQPLDLSEVVESTLAIARAGLPDGVELECDLAPGCIVRANPGQLQQVVLNLYTNAWQAMPDGGRLGIRVAHAEEKEILLEVSDTGPGIPEELRTRIFEPFFSQKPPGEGTGLGLSVVHGIVQNLGGSVTVLSGPGVGAVLEVRFPAAAAPDTASSAAPHRP